MTRLRDQGLARRLCFWLALTALLVCVTPALCRAAALGPADFQLRAPLVFSAPAATPEKTAPANLAKAVLPRQILEASPELLADARLFGPDNAELPFALLDNAPTRQKKTAYELKVRSYDKNQSDMVMVLEKPLDAPPLAALEIKTPSRDFRKNATLDASPDGNTWTPLAQDALYDFSSQIDLRKTRFAFPETGRRFLRLTLTDAGPQPEASGVQMQVRELEILLRGAPAAPLRLDAVLGLPQTESGYPTVHDEAVFEKPAAQPDSRAPKDTVIEIPSSLPADSLSFEIADLVFQREVEIYASGKEQHPRRIGAANLHRFALAGAEQRNTRVALEPGARAGYRIVIRNRDNPPLNILRVTLRWPQKLLFFLAPAPGQTPPALYLKPVNPAAASARPFYDLQRIAAAEDWPALDSATAQIGQLEPNPAAARQLRLAELEQWLLPASVVLICLALAGWLLALLRKAKPAPAGLDLNLPPEPQVPADHDPDKP